MDSNSFGRVSVQGAARVWCPKRRREGKGKGRFTYERFIFPSLSSTYCLVIQLQKMDGSTALLPKYHQALAFDVGFDFGFGFDFAWSGALGDYSSV